MALSHGEKDKYMLDKWHIEPTSRKNVGKRKHFPTLFL
jgi:hypothetical protein